MKKLTRMLVVAVVALISLTLFSSKVRADDNSSEAIQNPKSRRVKSWGQTRRAKLWLLFCRGWPIRRARN